MVLFPLLPFLLFFMTLSPTPASSKLTLEPGYSVSTVIDFNKLPYSIHPFSLLTLNHQNRFLLLLDSTGSAFYSLSIPSPSANYSEEENLSLFSGGNKDGKSTAGGFSDGDPTKAMFDKPRSFAVDLRDNVYVADKNNRAIRKITPSGVTTTIAGGYVEKTGHVDGPAQNASFSNDFDLVYVPALCTLLISDRGNRLIRQLDLKPQDCVKKTHSGLGVTPVSVIAVLSLLIGLVLGFVARPFFTSYEISNVHFASKTWKHYQTYLGRIAVTTYFAIRNAVAKSTLYKLMLSYVNCSLSYLSIVFRNIRLERHAQCNKKMTLERHQFKEPVSLLEPVMLPSNCGVEKPQVISDQLEDLISFEANNSCEPKIELEHNSEESSCKLDDMINTNMLEFGGKAAQTLVKRRQRG